MGIGKVGVIHKHKGSNTDDAFLKSLTFNKNRSGPKKEPCGTPHFTAIFSYTVFINMNVLQAVGKITLNPCVIPIRYLV